MLGGNLVFRLRSAIGAEIPPRVAVLRLTGVIGFASPLRSGLTLAGVAPLLEKAFRLPGLSAVALAINSPGGTAAQSSLIYRRIRALATEQKLPVVAFVEDLAASGGYWLACAADEIYADEASLLGSIGVITQGFGFQDLIRRIGVERRVYTTGPFKAMLDPFRPERPEDVERLKLIHTELFETFKALVRERRGARLKGPDDEVFTGAVWTGRRAVELGLADGIGDLRGVMRGRFGEKVKLVLVGERRGWLARRLRPGRGMPEDWVAAGLGALEERALWARYGL